MEAKKYSNKWIRSNCVGKYMNIDCIEQKYLKSLKIYKKLKYLTLIAKK